MSKTVVDELISFLRLSDMHFRTVHIAELVDDQDSRKIRLTNSDSLGGAPLRDSPFVSALLFFMVLDSYLDAIDPNLEGLSFRRKQELLPKDSTGDLILWALYRLLLLMRNRVVHGVSTVRATDKGLSLSFSRGNHMHEVDITRAGLELVYTVVIEIVSNSQASTTERGLALLRSYYDDILLSIARFGDDLGMLPALPGGLRLARGGRCLVTHPRYNLIQGNLWIEPDGLPSWNSDYLIPIDGNEYVIPEEALDLNSSIHRDNVRLWPRAHIQVFTGK